MGDRHHPEPEHHERPAADDERAGTGLRGNRLDLELHLLALAQEVGEVAERFGEAAAGLDLDGDRDGEEVHLRLVDDPRHAPERAVERLAEHHPLADRLEVPADRVVVLLSDAADALDHRQAGADAADDRVDRVGQLLHEFVGASAAEELHEAVGEHHAGEQAGHDEEPDRVPGGPGLGAGEDGAHGKCDQHEGRDRPVEPGAAEVGAQPRGVEQRDEPREHVGQGDEEVLFLLLAQEHEPRVVEVEPAGHALAPDPGEALAVLVLHTQHHGENEQAEPDRDRDRDDEDRADDDQVDRHPIASRSRVPRPKYSRAGEVRPQLGALEAAGEGAVGVLAVVGVLEQVLGGDDLALHPGDLGDLGYAALAVAHALIWTTRWIALRSGREWRGGQIAARHRDHVEAGQRIARGVGVDRAHGAVMAGVHGLQHVDGLAAADLTEDDAVGPHTKGVLPRWRMVIGPPPRYWRSGSRAARRAAAGACSSTASSMVMVRSR